MTTFTNPLTTTFELQRQSLTQGQELFEQTVSLQQDMGQSAIEGLEAQKSAQRQAIEFQHDAIEAGLDAIESTVPGTENPEFRSLVDEQFEQYLSTHSEAFEIVSGELQAGVETYDEFLVEFVSFVEEQLETLVETHEELETQSVEVTEQVTEAVQDQFEELQHQFEQASEQAVEAVEV